MLCIHVRLCTKVCIIVQLCTVPSAVRDLTVYVNYTNVTATWSSPADVNGELLSYRVSPYICMYVEVRVHEEFGERNFT